MKIPDLRWLCVTLLGTVIVVPRPVAAGEAALGPPPLLKDLRAVSRAWFNHDASTVLVQFNQGGTGLWEIATGRMISGECSRPEPVEGPGPWPAIIVRDDRKIFLVRRPAPHSRIYDARTGEPLSPVLKIGFTDHHRPQAKFSIDGKSLLIMDEKDRTHVLTVPQGNLRRIIEPPSRDAKEDEDRRVDSVFTPDGDWCFLLSAGGVARRYDCRTWKPAGPPMKHPHWNGNYFGLAVSADGRWIATTDSPGENGPLSYLQLWNGLTGEKHGPSLEAQNGWSTQFSGDLLFATPARGEGRVIDPVDGRIVYRISQHDNVEGPSISISPDGRYLLSWGYDRKMKLIDAKTGKWMGDLHCTQPNPTWFQWAPDSKFLYARGITLGAPDKPETSGTVKLSLPDLRLQGQLPVGTGVSDISPDGKKLVVFRDGISVVDADSMSLTTTPE